MVVTLCIVLAVVATLLLSFAITRKTSLEGLQAHHEIVDKYMMIVTAVYGIFLAFVITNLWATDDRAIGLVNAESSEIVYSAMLTSGLTSPAQQVVLTELRGYTNNILQEEWPKMQAGKGDEEILNYGPYERLWISVARLPQSEPDPGTRSRLLDAVHELGDLRRTRLLLSEDRLSPFFKVAILFGAVATVVPITFMRLHRWTFQVISSACAVGLLTMMVCLVFDLSSEYSGPTQISPAPYRTALEKLTYMSGDARWQNPSSSAPRP